MISRFIKAVVVLSLALGLSAKAEEVAVNVMGRGMSHSSAVLDGLKQAVAQVSGITIDVQSLYGIEESIVDVKKNDAQLGYSQLSQAAQSEIASRINGYISGYNILSSDKGEDNLYAVDMIVNIERYTSPGASNSNRYGLAVVGVRSEAGRCFGNTISESTIHEEATKALISAFTATRKFSVLDREEQEAYDLEKALIDSQESSAYEQIKLKNVKGTDYVLTGKVKDVKIWKDTETVELTGETVNIRGAKVTIEYKVLVFATRQVKFSSSVSVSLSGNEIKNTNCSDILSAVMKKAAQKISSDCIENIYPPRVVNVKGKSVYINMGGESVKMGATYAIYAVGEDLIDPYTGESLGAEETRIGMLKITAVKPKYSVGEMIEGDISEVAVNQICRQEAKGKSK